LKKLITILLICLSAINLSSCSTLEIVHVDLGCRAIPASHINYTNEEIEKTPDSVIDKFSQRSNQLKARIATICKDITAHNIESGKDR